VPNLKITFCKPIYFCPKDGETYSTSIHCNSYCKFQESTFSVLKAHEITNLNKKTMVVGKNNRLNVYHNGISKFNIYSNFTRYLLPKELLTMKLSKNSIKIIKSDFFGYKCKTKKNQVIVGCLQNTVFNYKKKASLILI
jgi:hypothetical protein